MLEVRQVRPKAAEQPRPRPRHPKLLRMSREENRLDTLGHEIRMPGHGGEPQIGSRARELAEQVQDIRLLSRPVAPENIGVDDDHTSSS